MNQRTSPPNVLKKHYSTIGIGDVFLEGPPHPLPAVYLHWQNVDKTAAFTSWEMKGNIKSTPEDFCVRELLSSKHTIPGLSAKDHKHLKVANILALDELPKQQLEKLPETSTKERDGVGETKQRAVEVTKKDANDSDSMEEVLRSFVARSLASLTSPSQSTSEFVGKLETLNTVATRRWSGTDCLEGVGSIHLPPLPDFSQEAAREARGDFHRAIKARYPQLYAKSITMNDTAHWIEISIDDSFDELIPFLLDPAKDIPALLKFHKDGLSDDKPQKTKPKAMLALKADVTKEQRKLVHHLLASRSKLFNTSTVADFKLVDGSTTTAISVEWDMRGVNRKRKRSNLSNKPLDPYTNTLVVFRKERKEHLTALTKIRRAFKCRESDLGVAGIKDMHAITFQFCTLRSTSPKRAAIASKQLSKYGISMSHFYKVDWILHNGDLDGNEFNLVIRNLKRVQVSDNGLESMVPCEEKHIEEMVFRIRRSGFINFYGEQRLGSPGTFEDVGVRAFDIGRAMLQQEFSRAVDLIITGRHGVDSRESDSAKRIRQTWKDTHGDPQATLKAFKGSDNIMTREKALLKGLNRYGMDKPLDALRCLSYSVRSFWINAYQSFIWNSAASNRIKAYGKKVVGGDLIQDESTGGVSIVEPGEVDKFDISQVVLPLPGHGVFYPENDVGEHYADLLAKDNVTFDNSGPPESRAKGAYRRLVIKPSKMESEMIAGEDAVRLMFQLPKGCYATMCLRELMLSTCMRESETS